MFMKIQTEAEKRLLIILENVYEDMITVHVYLWRELLTGFLWSV